MDNKLHFNIMLIVSLSSVLVMSLLVKGDIRYVAKNDTETIKPVKNLSDSITHSGHVIQVVNLY